MINNIDEYVGLEYNQGGDIRPTIENEQRYNILQDQQLQIKL